jgi:peptide deformylase
MSQIFGKSADMMIIDDVPTTTRFDRAAATIVKDPRQLEIPCFEVTKATRDHAKNIGIILKQIASDLDSGPKLNCAGLAANQIGENLRVIVLKEKNNKFRVFYNPVILRKSGKRATNEGCFSYPGKSMPTSRATRITITALNVIGTKDYDGIRAIAFQHELDHLNGVLI